jgi:predicted GNAT family acetyltransferase
MFARRVSTSPGGQDLAMTDVTHSPGISRFESGAAYLSYRRTDETLDIQHTVVPEDMGGQGVGGALVQAAVDFARKEDLELIVTCQFARGWLEKHPDA